MTDSLGRLIEGVWDHDTIVSGTRRDSAGVYQGEFSRDELFALLTHYGYFAYDNKTQKVHIPNQEVRAELLQVVKTGNRPELTKLIKDSDILLQATLAMDEEYVAEALDAFE